MKWKNRQTIDTTAFQNLYQSQNQQQNQKQKENLSVVKVWVIVYEM